MIFCKINYTFYLGKSYEIKKLPVLVGLLSVMQPFNHPLFTWPLGYFRKLALTYGARIIKLAHTPSCQGTNLHLGGVKLRTLGQCWIRTTDLSICIRTGNHWTNAPRQMQDLTGVWYLVYIFEKIIQKFEIIPLLHFLS